MKKIYIIVIIVLLAASPLIFFALRFLIKRTVMTVRIKRFCRRQDARLVKCNPFWWLGGKNGGGCDFYIETEKDIFAIKLFGAMRRQSNLCFTWDGRFLIRSFVGIVGGTGQVIYTLNGKKKPLPAYDFRYRFENGWELKNPHQILLVHPVCMEIRYVERSGDERILGTGEFIGDMEIQTLSGLLGMINETIS